MHCSAWPWHRSILADLSRACFVRNLTVFNYSQKDQTFFAIFYTVAFSEKHILIDFGKFKKDKNEIKVDKFYKIYHILYKILGCFLV